MQNALKFNKWSSNWVLQISKIEIEKEGPNNSVVLQN